jgi:hypothetical protein
MSFLKEIKAGLFIVQDSKDIEKLVFFQKISKQMNIKLIQIAKKEDAKAALKKGIKKNSHDSFDILSWRYSNWVCRKYVEKLKEWKKEEYKSGIGVGVKKMDECFFKINCESFFAKTCVDKLKVLYGAYSENRGLALRVATEMDGGDYDDPQNRIPPHIFSETVYKCTLNKVQLAFFVEQLQRLQVLKTLVEYCLYEEAGAIQNLGNEKIRFLGREFPAMNALPAAYRKSLSILKQHSHYHLYPVFWSWFILVFGGFICLDYKDKEYLLLSKKTGVPVDQIDNAFSIYKSIFPLPSGWFIDQSNSNIRTLKMFPAQLRGIGANYRRKRHTKSAQYKDLELTGDKTMDDIIKWNNKLFDLL